MSFIRCVSPANNLPDSDSRQANFFRHIGTILTFAFAGTFISAVALGIILWLWSKNPFEAIELSFVDAISVGATLSATDPITILAIFNTYKVDPKLYTVIFGESILNDAVAIVLFETAQRYKPPPVTEETRAVGGSGAGAFTTLKLFEGIGVFFLVFFGSLIIGLVVGIFTSLLLKFTMVRRFPKIESCLVLLIAYASYFFANSIHMSGMLRVRALVVIAQLTISRHCLAPILRHMPEALRIPQYVAQDTIDY